MDKSIKTERKKALFQYCFVCAVSLLVGAFISVFFGKGALLDLGEQIKRHFLSPFPENAPVYNFTISLLYYSALDIACIISAFLFTFSVFNYIASDIILIYQGFSIGLSASILSRYASLFNSISDFYIVWFTIFKILELLFFIFYLNTLTKYSFELKSYSANLRVRLDLKTLLFLLLFMISGCGCVLLLNTVYCIGVIIV